MKQLVVEASNNAHTLFADEIMHEVINDSTLDIKTKGKTIVKHGEHRTFAIESPGFCKNVQKEYNPILRSLQNAFD